jgi:mono/diheme cytochrome c family protein
MRERGASGNRSARRALVSACAAAVLGTAVGATAADTIPAAAQQEADEIWKIRCAACHGVAGKGDGLAAAALDPKPRDLTSTDWHEGATDANIEKVILEGGVVVGKSPFMPPNPDLASKPDVVKGLRAIVRDLAKP